MGNRIEYTSQALETIWGNQDTHIEDVFKKEDIERIKKAVNYSSMN